MALRRSLAVLNALALGAAALALLPPAPAAAQAAPAPPVIDTAAAPAAYGQALQADAGTVVGAEFVTRPPNGVANAVLRGPLAGFPRDGDSAVLLTTGDARLAPAPNSSGSSGATAGNGRVRGNTDYDVTVLRVDLQVPSTVNCLVGFDFRFLSEEFPEYVGSAFNDGFVAELDRSTWRTDGSTLTAPDNFAYDPQGRVISINSSGSTSMSAAEAAGTTYDGATPLLSAATPITPGPHSLFLSIFDQGDAAYDSAVLVDGLRFGRVADPATQCVPGARVTVPGLAASALLGPGNLASNISLACQADPVNCATGNFWTTSEVVALPGRSTGVAWERTYNSLAAGAEGPFGRGWASTLGMRAVRDPDGSVTVTQENGSTLAFTPSGSGFRAPEWAFAELAQEADGLRMTRRGDVSFLFDARGDLVEVAARSGEVDRVERDAAGRPVRLLGASGLEARLETDSAGRVTAVAAPGGRTTRYAYDDAGHLRQVTDAAGASTAYEHDEAGLLVRFVDPTGAAVQNAYDAQGRVLVQRDPLGAETTFAYAGDGDRTTTTVTQPSGQVTVTEFAGGTLRSRTVAAGTEQARTTTYAVDPTTLATTGVTDELGRTTSYEYDERGDLVAVELPSGARSTAEYDAEGDLVRLVDATGAALDLQTDEAGRLTARTAPTSAGAATTRVERQGPDVTAAVDPLGRRTAFTRDGAGRVTSVRFPSGATERYEHDAEGDVVAVTTAEGRTTRYAHDAVGRVTATTDPAGRTTRQAYDAAGRVVATTDADGSTTRVELDRAGRPTTVVDAAGRTRRNAYDASGRLVQVTDAAGRTTRYRYDAADQLVAEEGPLGVTTHAYDAAGQRTSTTDPAGVRTTYDYDADGNVVRVRYSDGTPEVRSTYDAAGRRTGTTDGTGSSSTTYDAAGRVLSQVDGAGQRVAYGYDLAGQLTTLTYPSGDVVRRSYDADGNLVRVVDPAGRASTFRYDRDGVLTGSTTPNGVSTAHALAADGTRSGTTVQRGAARLLALAWEQDADGLLAAETSSGAAASAPQRYAHDAVGRVTAAGTAQRDALGTTSYAYGPTDLLERVSGPGARTTTLAYDPAGLLLTATTGSGTATYAHDAAGRRTSVTSGDGQERLTWTGAGTLASYTGPRGGLVAPAEGGAAASGTVATTTYQVDARGLRTSRTTGDRTELFAYDLSGGLPQLLVAGDLQLVHGPGGQVLSQTDASGRTLWLSADRLGSTRLVTDETGKPVQSYSYSPYGVVDVKGGAAEPVTPVLWTGAFRDAESGLVHLHARTYDPATGQFLSVDPLAALSHTPHAYAFGSPLALVDPLGLLGWPDLDVVSAVLGGISAATGIAAVVATGTILGAPAGAVLGGISLATGAAGAAIDCRNGLSAGCGISAASAAFGGAGAIVKGAARVGRVSRTLARDVDTFTGVQAAHLSFAGTVAGVAGILRRGEGRAGGSATGAGPGSGGSGTMPVSPYYDPFEPCFS